MLPPDLFLPSAKVAGTGSLNSAPPGASPAPPPAAYAYGNAAHLAALAANGQPAIHSAAAPDFLTSKPPASEPVVQNSLARPVHLAVATSAARGNDSGRGPWQSPAHADFPDDAFSKMVIVTALL